MLLSRNPATGAVVRQFEPHTPEQVQQRLHTAEAAFEAYRKTSFVERSQWLAASARLLESETSRLARLMTLEMGKPLKAAEQEVAKCASGCRFYAQNAESFLMQEHVDTGYGEAFVRYQPLGPVLAIMPWNFPFWQVFRFAAPALMAGNVGLLKHASNVPQCALAIEELLARAGFPIGAFQTLLIGAAAVEQVIADPRVSAVTLTGSVEAGRKVASAAGHHLKKTVLELGGSDPFIVMPSADLRRAAKTAAQARAINNGQSCIAAKRFIVHEAISAAFEQEFAAAMSALRVGDPMDESVDVGPLATSDVLDDLEAQVRRSLEAGAKLVMGGQRMVGQGFFYQPTILADVPSGCPARTEEMFGPVAATIRVRNLPEAIQVANETSFGLGACIWTAETSEADLFTREIQSGLAFVNAMVVSDPRLPFGGIKNSGYGRELSVNGIREFTNVKSVVIQGLGNTSSRIE